MVQSFSFYNQEHQNALQNAGWFKLPLLSEQDVIEITELFKKLQANNPLHPFTLCWSDEASKKETYTALRDKFTPLLNSTFQSYRLAGAGFFYKAAHSSVNAVPPHQDWTFVDERAFSSVNIWVPLSDVDKSNGAYHVIEGSHKWPLTYRGSNIVSACMKLNYNFDELSYIPLHKGEAIIYDHRLIHATPPNKSGAERIAVVLTLIPTDAELLHCCSADGSSASIDFYKIDEAFYWKYTFSYKHNTIPEGYARFKSEDYAVPDYNAVFNPAAPSV